MAYAISDVSDLLMHFAADDLVGFTNGDPVGSWADSSPSGIDLTAAAGDEPEYVASAINSLPAVKFVASNTERMYSSTGLGVVPRNLAIAAVFKLTTLATWRGVFALDVSSPVSGYGDRNLMSNSGGALYFFGSTYDNLLSITADTWVLVMFSYHQCDRNSRLNGRYPGITDITYPTGLKATMGFVNSLYSDTSIAEIVLWDEDEAAPQSHYIEGFLADKYAISLDSEHPFFAAAPTTGPPTGAGGGLMKIGQGGGYNG